MLRSVLVRAEALFHVLLIVWSALAAMETHCIHRATPHPEESQKLSVAHARYAVILLAAVMIVCLIAVLYLSLNVAPCMQRYPFSVVLAGCQGKLRAAILYKPYVVSPIIFNVGASTGKLSATATPSFFT